MLFDHRVIETTTVRSTYPKTILQTANTTILYNKLFQLGWCVWVRIEIIIITIIIIIIRKKKLQKIMTIIILILIDVGDCGVGGGGERWGTRMIMWWVVGEVVIGVALYGRWSAGVTEQRVKAPGDVVGLHAAELLVDNRNQRGCAQDQQHQHLERQGRSHHPSEESVAAS